MVASLILTSAACSPGDHHHATHTDPGGTDPSAPVLTVSASDELAYLYVDGTLVYRAVATYPDGSTQEVTDKVLWSSSNTTAAVVDAGGLVTGTGLGKTVISATLQERPSRPESHAALVDEGPLEASAPLTVAFAPVISPMLAARASHSANLLPDGRVLLAGGYRNPSGLFRDAGTFFNPHTSSTEYFDPKTGAFEPGPDMPEGRQGHTGTTLADGSVLLAGGSTGYVLTNTISEDGTRFTQTTTQPIMQSALLYHPETGRFADPIPMTAKRRSSTATLLRDGRVLLTGGEDEAWNAISSAEVYDPTTMSFTATGSMSVPRTGHTAAILPSGRVLIAGGTSYSMDDGFSSTEVFDPETMSFSPGPQALAARVMAKAVSLPDGRVLLIGGGPRHSAALPKFYEIYDETTGSFTAWPVSPVVNEGFAVVSLEHGRVLIVGGLGWTTESMYAVSALAQIYDPATNTVTAANRMVKPRNYAAATLLADGQVLISGGIDSMAMQTDATEIFFDGDP